MPVRIVMHEPRGGRQITPPRRGFVPVEVTLLPGRNRVLEEDFTILAKNCERMKGALRDGEIQVVREDGNEHLLVDFLLPGVVTYRANKYVIPNEKPVTLEDKEWEELRKDPRFEALLQDGTIEFLGRVS